MISLHVHYPKQFGRYQYIVSQGCLTILFQGLSKPEARCGAVGNRNDLRGSISQRGLNMTRRDLDHTL